MKLSINMVALLIVYTLFLIFAKGLAEITQPTDESFFISKKELDTIKGEMVFLREKIETETLKSKEQISAHQLELDNMKAEIVSLKNDLAGRGRGFCYRNDTSSDTELNRAERLLLPSGSTHQPSTSVHVAFTAVLTDSIYLGELQEIKYDKVLLNIGSGYDARHGHFTSPVKGVYLLSLSTFKDHIVDDLAVEMVKNGVQLVANRAYSTEYNTGSHTIVVEMNKGDMVWVRHYKATKSISVYGTVTTPFTSFSGVLLFGM